MNYQELTSGEKARLVWTVLESIDAPADRDEFDESIALLCEDIPGLECQSGESLAALTADCWEIYLSALALPLSGNP